ncbi:calmodulin binding protein PICBP-like [Salvia hispanica]|uniref:calmodulin binding protein PICBP-like n=1 Tax=Salvia hispanica TaxID=49212 RepID=UPI0020090FDB|nr:calmodulin binding protein PICBP-like [Salvia hispanica]
MVQRKHTLLHLQPVHTHHHDSATKSPRGADLKAKKMKKSAPIKRPKAATPNYMKPTTSSDARKEQPQSRSPSPSSKKSATKPSFKPSSKTVDAKTATCSSTLKDSKFPPFLSLNKKGHSDIKVCPYTYCSLNGRRHPPLSSFISAARRARAPPARPDDDPFFVEIYTAPQERVSDQESFDDDNTCMDWESGYGYGVLLQYDYKAEDAMEIKHEFVEEKVVCFDEVLIDEAAQESFDENGGFDSNSFSSSEISTPLQEEEEEEKGGRNEEYLVCDAFSSREISTPLQKEEEKEEKGGGRNEEISSLDVVIKEYLPKEDMITLLQFAASSKKIAEEGDEAVGFNPRAPNFLDVEEDAEGERVDLRHQDVNERRNSEEWMVDYALRQVVTKLAPAKKKKVALLVEAFERVMPLPFDHHLTQFDHPRSMLACS